MSIERDHTDYHLRNLDQQVLDALLRIEELLTQLVKNTAPIDHSPAAPAKAEPQPAKKGRFSK